MGSMLVPDDAAAPTATPITRTSAKWGSVERHYIKCLKDNAMPQALAQKMVDTADQEFPSRKTVLHAMNTSHSPFLSQPQGLAQLLASIALS